MRKAVVGGMTALMLAVVALVLAPTIRAQVRDRTERPAFDRLLLQGAGSQIGVGVRELRAEELSSVKLEPGGRVSIALPDAAQQLERFRAVPRDFNFSVPEGIYRGSGFGLTLFPLSGQLAAHFGAQGGVLVSAVDESSVAAQAGVRAGDVITAVGGRPVENPADVMAAFREAAPGSSVEIRLMRDKREMTVRATIPDRRVPERNAPQI